ncbi:MAG: DUF4230 domain-containing protein [Prevotella sp.]
MEKENNGKTTKKHENIMTRYINFRTSALLTLVIIVITLFVLLLYKCSGNRIEVSSDNRINLTPAQITALKETGQWEFLSIEDEEIVDTLRKRWLGEDCLIRIYYGTLRLGFDMNDVEEGWISTINDTIKVVLPKIRLLDENFIDEARTKSFYQSGQWSDADRARMLVSAKEKMKARGLGADNIKAAEDNARSQIRKMIENITGKSDTHVVITIKR